MKYICLCPSCESERPAHEMYCQNIVDEEQCSWLLMNVAQTPSGGNVVISDTNSEISEQKLCTNGHPVSADDFICMECGADILEANRSPEINEGLPTIGDWTCLTKVTSNNTKECFEAVDQNNRKGFVTLYHENCEPDTSIYNVLRSSDIDHIPEIYETARWQNRPYEVCEWIDCGTLHEKGFIASENEKNLTTIVDEIARALHAFSLSGLRHRDLCPHNILVRNNDSLDLVITDFGSARLSDYDLDTVSPLEITRYSAPETIIGGVSSASDWWSLGMILLEQLTKGQCFANINDKAFMIHIVTRGMELPESLPKRAKDLLQGLLCKDPVKRWQWSQVQKWLNNEYVEVPQADHISLEQKNQRKIKLNQKSYTSPEHFALNAAEETNWKSALELFTSGALGTWIKEIIGEHPINSAIHDLKNSEEIELEWRFSLSLMLLNSSLPLTWRGQIVIPAWLLHNPKMANQLITSSVPEFLEKIDREKWLVKIHYRYQNIQSKAKTLEIDLDDQRFQINSLSTSRARLIAESNFLRKLYPE